MSTRLIIMMLPIGIDDYSLINNNYYYYVDKTLIIKELLEGYIGKTILFTRPRRFGKSLMLSMLDSFFSFKHDTFNLFKDKKIIKELAEYNEYLNNYPVIHLNFKDLQRDTKEEMLYSIIDIISKLYREHYDEIFDSLKFEVEKKEYLDIINKENIDISIYANSIKELTYYIYRKYNKKVIILIDEYDTPVQCSFEKGYYDEIIAFFKSFYSSSLKSNDYSFISIVTGVLEISKESLFSGLNNLNVFSILDEQFSEYFGFSVLEVKEMLDYFGIDADLNQIMDYYGGYGPYSDIINPWSISNFVFSKKFDNYWLNTGSNYLIGSLLLDVDNKGYDRRMLFAEFINNNDKIIDFNRSINYKELNNTVDSMFSLLVQSGYLTALNVDGNKYILRIPNKEIMTAFSKEVLSTELSENSFSNAIKLKKAFEENDALLIQDILEKQILNSFSYYDLRDENEFKVLIITLIATLFDNYVIKNEVNYRFGRCDILIFSKNKKDFATIIELKKAKGVLSQNRLNKLVQDGLEQIKEREYYTQIQDYKNKIIYSFAIDDKHLKVVGEIL